MNDADRHKIIYGEPVKVYVERDKVAEAVYKHYRSFGVRAVNSMEYYGILPVILSVEGVNNPLGAYEFAKGILDEASEKYKVPNPDGSKSEYYRGRRDAAKEIMEKLKPKKQKRRVARKIARQQCTKEE